MKRLNLRLKLLILLGGLTPTLAPAQLPPWYGPLPTWGGSFTYDIGAHPRVSGGSPYIGIVDIHQPATWSNQLWERPSGWIKIDPTQPEFRYWYGYAPTMAAGNWPISNTGASRAFVVEVDQTNQTGPCYLWYNLMSLPDYLQGVLSGGGLLIGGGYADYGCHPTVAVQGPDVISPGPKVVEVHQDQEGWGTLYYKVGTVIPYTEPGWTNKAYIAWGPSQAFDTAPIRASRSSMTTR